MCQRRNPILTAHTRLFFRLGTFVYENRRLSSWITISICAAFCAFLPMATFRESFRDGYFLTNSKSVEEHRTFLEFYEHTSMPYVMALFGECTDSNCSMLEPDYFMEMREELKSGKEALLATNDFGERPPLMLQNFLIYSNDAFFKLLEESFIKPTPMMLQYPYLIVGNSRIFLHQVAYGAQYGSPYALRYLMAFNADNPTVLAKLKYAEVQWYEKLKSRTKSKVNLYLLGDAVVDYEIQKASLNTCVYFGIGALLMISILYRIIWQYNQGRKVNMLMTFLTVFCPTLAGLSTFGIFALCRIPINSTMLITPFLVLGVGVDDAFRLMNNWFYALPIRATRYFIMYTDIGPSISLSSMTNVAAFLIGYLLSPSKDIALFCLCSAVAFAWCWVLQIFFFAPQMSLYAAGKVPQNSNRGFHVPAQYFTKYSSILGTFSCCHILVVVLMLLLYSISIFASIHMEENFAPEKTFDGDSFLAKSLASLNKIYSDHQMVQILVTKVPGNSTVLMGDVARLLSSELLCENYTTWIQNYAQMYDPSDADVQEYFKHLPDFIKLYPDIVTNVAYGGNQTLVKLSFDLCLKGCDTWRQRALEASDLRRTLPEGYSMFFYDSHIFDLILSVKGTILNAVGITLIAMMVICVFFLPSFRVAMCSFTSLLSTMILVIGGLCFWGADLDVVLMVNIIMAAGFTVDYISHVSYNLFLEGQQHIGLEPVERMVSVLLAITGPTAQAALTTIVCVLPLMFHKVYMYVIFAKTIILCSTIGFLHAVFIMPFLISLTEMIVPSRFLPLPQEAVGVPQEAVGVHREAVGIPLKTFRIFHPGKTGKRPDVPSTLQGERNGNQQDVFRIGHPIEPGDGCNAPYVDIRL